MLASVIIKSALRKIGALSRGFEPASEDMEDALEELNAMLAGWANEELLIPHYTRENFTLTQGQIAFTIGAAATLATVRPVSIHNAFLRDANSIDWQLTPFTLREANGISDKTAQGRPERYNYDYGDPNGTIRFDYACDQAYGLYIDSLKPVTQFTSISADDSFPEEYTDLVRYNLGVRLAPEVIGEDAPRMVIELAKQLRKDAKAVNEGRRLPVLELDSALLNRGGHNYNINAE